MSSDCIFPLPIPISPTFHTLFFPPEGRGHIARDCHLFTTDAGAQGGSAIDQFRALQSNQHIRLLQNRDKRFNDPRACNLCGHPGHIARECQSASYL